MTEVPADTLPFHVIAEVQEAAPELTLIGSFVRDYWVRHVAKLPFTALTVDVDVAVLVDSMDQYLDRLGALDGPSGTGLVYRVLGHQVDVIPYGNISVDGIVEPAPGVTLDVTGMAEAAQHAVTLVSGPHRVAVPTLAHTLALKVIAWGYRGDTEPKDARDLGPLLDATSSGPFADVLWDDDVVATRCGYDPVRMGPYRVAREIAGTWQPASVERLLTHLTPAGQDRLAARIVSRTGGRVEDRLIQLDALTRGLTDPD